MNTFARKIVAALVQVQGSSIASINTETVEELTGGKKNPMQGRVTKRTEGGKVMFFTNTNSNAYNNMVKRRLEAEGKDANNFTLGKRTWGERMPETPFVQHNNQLYVEVVYLAAPKIIRYFFDGVAIAKEAIIGLKENKAEGAQGGLENKVVIRTYKLENVKQIKMGDLSVME